MSVCVRGSVVWHGCIADHDVPNRASSSELGIVDQFYNEIEEARTDIRTGSLRRDLLAGPSRGIGMGIEIGKSIHAHQRGTRDWTGKGSR